MARALHEARAAFAVAAAAPLGERLLALWDLVPDAEAVVGSSYGRLAAVTINLLEDMGASARGVRLAELVLAQDLPSVERAELLLVSARSLSPVAGGWEASRERMDAALALLDGDPSPEARAVHVRVLAVLAQNPHVSDPVDLLERAMALAEEADDPDLIATVLRARAIALYGRVSESVLLEELHRAAKLPIDPVRHYTTMTNLVAAYFHMRRYEEAIEIALVAYEECVQLGLERGVGAFLLANAAEAQLASGQYDAGMATGRRTIELRPAQGFHSFAVRTLARAAIWNDREDDAESVVENMDETVWMPDDPDEVVGWSLYETERLLLLAETETGERRTTAVAEAVTAIAPVFSTVTQNADGARRDALPTVAWVLRAAAEASIPTAELSEHFARDAEATAANGENATVLALIAAEAAPTGTPDAVAVWEQAVAVDGRRDGDARAAALRTFSPRAGSRRRRRAPTRHRRSSPASPRRRPPTASPSSAAGRSPARPVHGGRAPDVRAPRPRRSRRGRTRSSSSSRPGSAIRRSASACSSRARRHPSTSRRSSPRSGPRTAPRPPRGTPPGSRPSRAVRARSRAPRSAR